MARLTGGIIGCGFFAQNHIEAWRRMSEVELAAACDLDVERARRAAPRAYKSAEEMLDRERFDFVDIATTPATHLPLVRLALDRKIPTICQKPMAPTLGECVEMAEIAEAAGVPLMIHENWRWQPWFREVKRRLEGGAIGRPLTYLFRTRKNDGGGPAPYAHQPYFRAMPRLLIYETLVHHLDTARFLFGDIASVYAQTRRLNSVIAGEDQVLMLVTHADCLQGTIDGHRFLDLEPDSPPLGDAFFEGDRGYLHVAPNGDVYQSRERVWKNDVTEGYRGDSVRATQQHFMNCLRSGAPMESGAREYLKTFRAVEAGYRSAAERRTVDLAEIV